MHVLTCCCRSRCGREPGSGRYETDEYTRIAQRIGDLLIHGLAGASADWSTGGVEQDSERTWKLTSAVDSTSEAFLRAATVLVNEQGYRGASIDRISARLNVTKGSFYHHHDTKHDLIAECFERTFAVMRQALSLAEDGPGSGWSRACAAARALVRFQPVGAWAVAAGLGHQCAA